MSKPVLGTLCGIVFGVISVVTMIPLDFPDKRAALLGAFVNRLSIGFIIGAFTISLPEWAKGLLVGLLLSLPDAIITKAFAPILSLGVIEGLIIGVVVQKWGRQKKQTDESSRSQ